MPKYAIVKNNGKVITVTNASHALENDWVLVTDDRISAGDTIDKATGALVTKDAPTQAEQRQVVRAEVRRLLRESDWTQAGDNLSAPKQLDWKNYRQALRDNWQTAKASLNPVSAMVWPVAPGEEFDGLA